MQNISESMEVIHLSDPYEGYDSSLFFYISLSHLTLLRISELYNSLEKAKELLQNTMMPLQKGETQVDGERLVTMKGELEVQLTEVEAAQTVHNEWMKNEHVNILKQLHVAVEICEDLEMLAKLRKDLKIIENGGSAFPQVIEMQTKWEAKVQLSFKRIALLKWKGDILDTLHEDVKELLDEGQNFVKLLSEQLEQIRDKSPRLYFISDTDLLNLIIDSHKGSQFDKILGRMLQFDSFELTEERQIHSLVSEGERLILKNSVNAEQDIAGIVEDLEERMEEAVRQNNYECLKVINKSDALELMSNFLQQSVLFAKKIKSTAEIEDALKKSKIAEHQEQARVELHKYAKYITSNSLSRNEENNLTCFIIYAMHERDIAARLAKTEGASHESIEWLRYARMYPVDQGNAVMKIVQVEMPLTYEYQGNKKRLIITPLSDRAYVTLSTAAVMNQIGTNVGFAGTGKTETSKDLAMLLGRMWLVVNANKVFDCGVITKILRGAAGCGSWVLLDQLQTLLPEPLSALAHQAQQIYNTLAQGKQLISLEGKDSIKLKSTFALLGSIQYRTQQSSEINQSYKAMLRCNTLVVPDFHIISQGMLYNEGFTEAQYLSTLLNQVFQLGRDTLSQQESYDFGLRCLKTVIKGAGQMLRSQPSINQASCLRHLIQFIFFPKLVADDAKLFKEILDTVFSEVSSPIQIPGIEGLRSKLQEIFIKLGSIANSEYLVQKASELVLISKHRHGLGLVGESFSAKLLIIEAAAQACEATLTRIHPQAMTEAELYGDWTHNRQFKDGIFTKVLREIAEDKSEKFRWIVFDGPVDPEWVQSLNTILDDNKHLVLKNGEIIPLKANTRILFNVQNLKTATPAFVSRIGVINTDSMPNNWSWKIQSALPNGFSLKQLPDLEETIALGLDFMKSAKLLIDLSDEHLVQNVLTLLKAQLKQATDPHDSLLFALIWSFGGVLTPDERPRFDTFIRSLRFFQKTCFPKKSSVFEVALRREGHKDIWKPWLDDDSPSKLAPLSPTLEMASQIEIISLLAAQGTHVLLTGPCATGKTACARKILRNLENSKHTAGFTLNPSTSPQILKNFLQETVSKHQKSVIFLDGLNLPSMTKYNVSPVQEVIREFILSTSQSEQEISIIAAMDCSLSNSVNSSLMGQFTVLGFPELRDDSIRCVLSAISEDSTLLDATLQAYSGVNQKIQSKSWNLYNLEQILEGIQLARSEDIAQVWAHQAYHTFADRLYAFKQKQIVAGIIKEVALSHFSSDIDVDTIVMAGIGPRESQPYEEKQSLEALRNEVKEAVASLGQEQDILIHQSDQILEHFLRISRGLRKEQSHLLLVSEDRTLSKQLTRQVCETMKLQYCELIKENWKFKLDRNIRGNKENGEESVLLISEENMDERMMLTLHNIVADGGRLKQFKEEEDQGTIHIVTLISSNPPKFAQKYPALFNKVVIDYFGGVSKESMEMLVEQSLANTELD